MADGISLVKAPEEQVSAFNQRLLSACGDFPITSVQLVVIDGQPMVTLFSESVEADEEDVEEAKEAGEEISVGDLIPTEDPVVVQVTQVRADSLDAAKKAQDRMETLYKRANGGVTSVLHASGKGLQKIVDPQTKKISFDIREIHYAAVVYNPSEEAEQAEADETAAP